MSIDSVNLYAANLYGKMQNQQITRTTPEPIAPTVKATKFQDLVSVNFNNFAKLSPDEILNKINVARSVDNVRDPAVRLDLNNSVASELSNLRQTLTKQETQVQKASIGQANLVELMTATTRAENYLNTFVTLRDELKTAWERIWSMSV